MSLTLKQTLPSNINAPTSNNSKSHQFEVSELKEHESSIVSHVQAHISSGGTIVSLPSYVYTTSKSGIRFISSGDVTFKMFKITEHQSTQLDRAKTIEKAALAPINPTPQDRSVSILAQALASLALKSLNEQRDDQVGHNIDVNV